MSENQKHKIMRIDENFVFTTSVSIDCYDSKAEATACLSREGAKSVGKQKMAFVKQQVTVKDFLTFATTGHCFCNLFGYDSSKEYYIQCKNGQHYKCYPEYKRGPNKGGMKLSFKSDEYFIGTQTVFVDIDNTRYTDVRDYLSTLSIQPTCVYMSFSDNIPKHGQISRRFRLVYVFDKILDKAEFEYIAQFINNQVEIDTGEPLDDDCGKRMSQYMNGVRNKPEVYRSDIIYSVRDFIIPTQYPTPNPCRVVTTPPEEIAPLKIEFNQFLLSDMQNLSYEDFMHRYSTKYKYFYRTETKAWGQLELYQTTDENYLQTWWYSEKVTDGHHRRRKLFKNACLRRLIYPDVDPETLLFNLYVDTWRFFDNSDGVITIDTLKRKVKNAFSKSVDELESYCKSEIEYWKMNRPLYIVNPIVPNKQKWLPWINKNIRKSEFFNNYNPYKSITENSENLGIPRSTAYRYCKERGFSTNRSKGVTDAEKRKYNKQKDIELFKRLFDNKLSIRDNKEKLERSGLKLSIGGIHNWKNKYL